MHLPTRTDDNREPRTVHRLFSVAGATGLSGLRAAVVSLYRQLQTKRAQGRSVAEAPHSHSQPSEAPARPAATPGWDAVDEASWESFPASDPPTGWAGKDIKPPTLNGE